MPQPLSRAKADAHVRLEIADQQASLCVHITRVISAWAHIDHLLTEMLASLLQADFDVVAAMYQAIKNDEAKRAVIVAAAEKARPEHAILIQSVLNASKVYRKRRNQFAHHIWASSPQLPDALILIDPEALFDRSFEEHRRESRGEMDTKVSPVLPGIFRIEPPKKPKTDRSRMFVWKEKELRESAEDADACSSVYWHLNHACGRQPNAGSREALLSVPRVRKEFERLSQQSGQAAQPPPPPQSPTR